MDSQQGSKVGRTGTGRIVGVVVAVITIAAVIVAAMTMPRSTSESDPDLTVVQSSSSTAAASPSRPALPSSQPRKTLARWVDYYHLVVDGKRVPGRWGSVTSREHAWLAFREERGSGTYFWGTSLKPHELDPRCCARSVELSFDGRWIAYAVSSSAGRSIRLLDTTTGQIRAELPVPAEYGPGLLVEGVTNDGVVLLLGCGVPRRACDPDVLGPYADFPMARYLWLPDDGRVIDVPGYNGKGKVLEAGFILSRTSGRSMSIVGGGTVLGAALVRVDRHGHLRVVAHLPRREFQTSEGWPTASIWLNISPDATWLVRNGVDAPDMKGPIAVRPLNGGPTSVLDAPTGWTFDNVGWGLSWESDDVFVSNVMRRKPPRGSAYARCSISLGTCVLIDE